MVFELQYSNSKRRHERVIDVDLSVLPLLDVFSKSHVLEFANEVAILRLIGNHPNIIQFMGCAQRSSKLRWS